MPLSVPDLRPPRSRDTLFVDRSRSGIFVYPAFLATLYVSSSYAASHPWVIHGTAAGVLLLALWRFALLGRHARAAEADGPVIVRRLVWAILATAALWGLFQAATLWLFGYGAWPSVVLLVCTAGAAAGSVPANGSRPRLGRAYLALLLGPAIAVHLAIGGREGLSMAILFSVYLAYLLRQVDVEHADLRRAESDTQLLRLHAQAVEEARDEAQQASRTKSEFLANMSHELRTPLNSIIGYSEMLIDEIEVTGHTSAVADLERIRAAGRHQLGLVNDILDISRIEAGRVSILIEPFDVRELLMDVIEELGPQARQNGNRLEAALAHAPDEMRSDASKVRQVLVNLLGNACKFTSDGTVTLTATTVTHEGRPALSLCIADTGIGIDAATLPQLFRPFTQADGSETRRYGGSGLGLALTRAYCQMLGGRVAVASTPGAGSTFTAVLPLDAPDAA